MTEVLFYHLDRHNLEEVLPNLLEKARDRKWSANVRVGSAERMEALDSQLWTYSDQSFLAHGTAADGQAARQLIYLTTEADNPNNADVLFLVDGAMVEDWSNEEPNGFQRIVLLFDGHQDEMLNAARAAWKNAKDAGHDVTYWKESPRGRWEKQE